MERTQTTQQSSTRSRMDRPTQSNRYPFDRAAFYPYAVSPSPGACSLVLAGPLSPLLSVSLACDPPHNDIPSIRPTLIILRV
ncbi:uncharacterized protein CIMG_13029 [Coccidioides immitis RS]|uniref:Uncharacterized protein n=1 Tax=Coccidioides immitis (strain RS) TaxID=246410 RepID=A0A0D8JTR0_COCIM|nr:uncharacterized protein CIMG_13029 [Coccidioides immitis RS]KJF60534.1 hypothetical protein CIMG_13029 [Coccidioides immitis RS]